MNSSLVTCVDLTLVGEGRPGDADCVRSAVGTLPGWFRLTAAPTKPYAAWVLAGDGLWPGVVARALESGADVVVLDSPEAITVEDIRAFSDAPAPIILAGPRSHAPQFTAFAQAVSASRASLEWAELLVTATDSAPSSAKLVTDLWDAITLLRVSGLPVTRLARTTFGAFGVVADGVCGATAIHISCVRTPLSKTEAHLKAFGPDGSIRAFAADPRTAAPGAVVSVSAESAITLPTHYQTPRRLALREVHDVVTQGLVSPHALPAFAPDAALLDQVRAEAAASRRP